MGLTKFCFSFNTTPSVNLEIKMTEGVVLNEKQNDSWQKQTFSYISRNDTNITENQGTRIAF